MRRNDDAFTNVDDYIYIDIPTPMPMTNYDEYTDNQLRRCTDKPMNNYNDNDTDEQRHTSTYDFDDDE